MLWKYSLLSSQKSICKELKKKKIKINSLKKNTLRKPRRPRNWAIGMMDSELWSDKMY